MPKRKKKSDSTWRRLKKLAMRELRERRNNLKIANLPPRSTVTSPNIHKAKADARKLKLCASQDGGLWCRGSKNGGRNSRSPSTGRRLKSHSRGSKNHGRNLRSPDPRRRRGRSRSSKYNRSRRSSSKSPSRGQSANTNRKSPSSVKYQTSIAAESRKHRRVRGATASTASAAKGDESSNDLKYMVQNNGEESSDVKYIVQNTYFDRKEHDKSVKNKIQTSNSKHIGKQSSCQRDWVIGHEVKEENDSMKKKEDTHYTCSFERRGEWPELLDNRTSEISSEREESRDKCDSNRQIENERQEEINENKQVHDKEATEENTSHDGRKGYLPTFSRLLLPPVTPEEESESDSPIRLTDDSVSQRIHLPCNTLKHGLTEKELAFKRQCNRAYSRKFRTKKKHISNDTQHELQELQEKQQQLKETIGFMEAEKQYYSEQLYSMSILIKIKSESGGSNETYIIQADNSLQPLFPEEMRDNEDSMPDGIKNTLRCKIQADRSLQNLGAKQPTPVKEKELAKKIIKRQRNRKYSRNSRTRTKDMLDDTQHELQELQEKNQELKETMYLMETE